jgi:L-lactate dehydrogenase complex protein LldG
VAGDELAHGPVVDAPRPFETSLDESNAIHFDPSAAELRISHTGVSGSELGVASVGTIAIEYRPYGDEIVSLDPQHNLLGTNSRTLYHMKLPHSRGREIGPLSVGME